MFMLVTSDQIALNLSAIISNALNHSLYSITEKQTPNNNYLNVI